MNVIAVQSDVVWENPPANFANLRRWLVNAAPERNSLVALPEMFATGFSMNAAATAETVGGATEQFLARTAQELGICLVAGVARRGSDGKARNQALVFSSEGELLTCYTKQRPFSPGGEAEHYTAGEQSVTFRWNDCTVSPFICYDLRFPELFREAVAAHRPELIGVIANWPAKRIHHWVRLLQARAIENQAYVLGVNRVGADPHYAYCGRSLIIDPHGEILADAGEGEGVIQVKLDLASLRKYREGLPFLADLRWE